MEMLLGSDAKFDFFRWDFVYLKLVLTIIFDYETKRLK